MYKLYILVENKMLPIGNDNQISVFQEDQLSILKEQQKRAYDIDNIMWIIYTKEKENGI